VRARLLLLRVICCIEDRGKNALFASPFDRGARGKRPRPLLTLLVVLANPWEADAAHDTFHHHPVGKRSQNAPILLPYYGTLRCHPVLKYYAGKVRQEYSECGTWRRYAHAPHSPPRRERHVLNSGVQLVQRDPLLRAGGRKTS